MWSTSNTWRAITAQSETNFLPLSPVNLYFLQFPRTNQALYPTLLCYLYHNTQLAMAFLFRSANVPCIQDFSQFPLLSHYLNVDWVETIQSRSTPSSSLMAMFGEIGMLSQSREFSENSHRYSLKDEPERWIPLRSGAHCSLSLNG